MSVENDALIVYLREIDEVLEKRIELIAVGGTALTLLELKTSTKDIDLELMGGDVKSFRKALDLVPSGFKVDIFEDGRIFSTALPDDHRDKVVKIDAIKFENIDLYTLDPLDIIVTKIGRADERDLEDIEAILGRYKYTKEQIEERASQVFVTCSEEAYQLNLKMVLKRFY